MPGVQSNGSADGGFITAWNTELKIQTESGNKVGSSSSDAGGSSAVYDAGDSGQLYQRRQQSEPCHTGTDKDQLVKDVGSRFRSSSHHSRETSTPDSKASTLRDRSPTHAYTTLHLGRDGGSNLENKIQDALETCSGTSKKRFLPFSKLDKIFTYEAIADELRTLSTDGTQGHPQDLAHEIFDEVELAKSNLTTRRKIFATLIRIHKAACIIDFIKEGLYDCHLPFYFPSSHEQQENVYRKTKQDEDIPIQCFKRWKRFDQEIFERYQWEFLAPFFEVTPTNGHGKRPLHYSLGYHTILPFIEDYEEDGQGDLISSGYSEVWRVRIHPSHHSHPSSENPYFAVKRLKPNYRSDEIFKQEVLTLKRLSSQDHAHLMKLELTYLYQERYHLLFRWADGNLRDYWERYPEPSNIPRTHEFATWVSGQWLGLAEALMAIHECPPDSDVTADDEADVLAPQRTNGRHGDIKPENILWFQSHERGSDRSPFGGRLVISDFGLTEFHRDETGLVSPMNVANSPTYRAPEYDVSETISQSYDIWTMGCVLLEFIVWYLKGFEAFDQFSKDRAAEDNQLIRQDVYFKLVGKTRDRRQFSEAVFKKAVALQFASLREQPEVTELLMDALGFIEEKMLRMDPDKRATCKELVDEFRTIHEKALVDEKYCLQPVPGKPKRVNTDLSTLSPFIFDTTESGASNSKSPHSQGRQSRPFPVSGAAEKVGSEDDDGARPLARIEEVKFQQRTLDVPVERRDFGGKRREDFAPSTNGSSSGNTSRGDFKLPFAVEDDGEGTVKRRGLRQRLRSLLCW